jgi:hypothetical protein
MNNKMIYVALLCVLATACQQEQTDAALDTQASARNTSSGAEERAGASRSDKAVLLAGYTPPFAHNIRSQRHEPAGGRYRHVVIVEYLDADAKEVIEALQSDLAARGFSVDGPAAYQDAIRMTAEADDGASMVITVHGAPDLELHSPGAQGLVTFSWLDSESR